VVQKFSEEIHMEKHEEALYSLRVANAKSLRLSRLNNIVLSDPAFLVSPGGSEHHHNYKHGLVIHVNEVMQNVLALTVGNPSDELRTAVIWHDYMKIHDYSIGEYGEIVKMPYRKLINHVAGSAMEFHLHATSCLDSEQLERIEHLLLSHHGRREWGSPVEPLTSDALILHAADMMSAKGVNIR
jgi:3'-5' exoribonuclease